MSASPRRGLLPRETAFLLFLAVLAVWLRWTALGTEGFHNEDAAGITYNADLLRSGGLPLVDNLELKAPGSFFVAWLSWAIGGRSIATLQVVACMWSIIGALGIYAGGRWLFDRRSAGIAALMYVLFSPITDSIDINYGAWMAAPYIWSAAFFVAGLKSGRVRWWVACGAALAIAGLMKRQGAFATPLFFVLILAGPRLPRPSDWADAPPIGRSMVAFFGGLGLGFAPIMLWYLAQGELGAFIGNYFFSEGGWKYAATQGGGTDRLARFGDGLLGFFEYMRTATICALITGGAMLWRRAHRRDVRAIFLWGHFTLSFVGAAIGLRFFKGYYLQILPAAVWLAAHPAGLLRRWFEADRWRGPRKARLRTVGIAAVIGLMLAPIVNHDLLETRIIRYRRMRPMDTPASKVGEFIRANTDDTDRIWVWGRWGWPIYFHADRLAATRFPKTLAVFTTNLTNTWRRPTEPTRFDPDSDWPSLMADLETNRPAFMALARNESYRGFDALRAFLKSDYRRVRLDVREFAVYRRKDVKLRVKPPKPKPKKPKAGKTKLDKGKGKLGKGKGKGKVRKTRTMRPRILGRPVRREGKGATPARPGTPPTLRPPEVGAGPTTRSPTPKPAPKPAPEPAPPTSETPPSGP